MGALLVVVLGVTAALVAGLALPAPSSGATGAAAPSASQPLGQRVLFGAYVDGMFSDPTQLTRFEKQVGRTSDIASYYYGYDGAGDGGVFPGEREATFAAGGSRTVLLGWDLGPTRFTEWTRGQHDGYLQRIADAANAYPHDVYVRPWAEMNGDWASYQPTAAGDKPHGGTYRQFRRAWRHVVSFMREQGATNLRWVFNVDAATYRGTTPIEKIWPGRRYVDVLGLDGYNWGRSTPTGAWRSFSSIFAEQYERLTALHPRAPVWICELGSKEPRVDDGAPVDDGRSKAAWIRKAFSTTDFPRITGVVWFDENKERDWRVASSSGSLRAMKRAVGER